MAEKKKSSRAAKAVSDAKKKTSGSSQGKKTSGKKTSESNHNKPVVTTEYDHDKIPGSLIVALVSLALFVLFVVISVNPDGALLKVIQSVVLGLIGQAGFYFSIPALLYLFLIHTFRQKRPVKMRSICVIVFVFLCGCVYHLAVQNQGMAQGIGVVKDLYTGGVYGNTGGILCGGAAMLLRWGCGNIMSFIICIIGAILTLLGAMQITIPSI